MLMTNATQPTKQSLDWVERDLITLKDVASRLNASDILTKQTGPMLFALHVDNLSPVGFPHHKFPVFSHLLLYWLPPR